MEDKEQRHDSRSRSRQAENDVKSVRSSGRSKSRQGRKKKSTTPDNNIFEFDMSGMGEDTTNNKSSTTARSVKSRSSRKSSSKSVKTNKSAKSTSKSVRSSKSTKSKSKSNKSRIDDEAAKAAAPKVLRRGSSPGSAQRYISQGASLRVAKMPYKDRYNREGKYTGEINRNGQPDGEGTLRYNNGTVFDGQWVNGQSEEMDVQMERASSSGFSGDWKSQTRTATKKRHEQDMDDIKSFFLAECARSGMSGGSVLEAAASVVSKGSVNRQGSSVANGSSSKLSAPSSQGSGSNQMHSQQQQQQQAGNVNDMPWSDVNGFSGHYSGEVNSQSVPDGRGYMRYSNGVVEEGIFCNGVYQPPTRPPPPPPRYNQGYVADDTGDHEGGEGGVPSSSMSVWSLKSSPTMALHASSGHNVLSQNQRQQQQHHNANAGAVGAPSSVHLGGLYGNMERRY